MSLASSNSEDGVETMTILKSLDKPSCRIRHEMLSTGERKDSGSKPGSALNHLCIVPGLLCFHSGSLCSSRTWTDKVLTVQHSGIKFYSLAVLSNHHLSFHACTSHWPGCSGRSVAVLMCCLRGPQARPSQALVKRALHMPIYVTSPRQDSLRSTEELGSDSQANLPGY